MSAALEFCGRSKELQTLVERWRLASDVEHPSPQVVVVKAEPGYGKTRLVQELYRWLSENADKDAYWPDALRIVEDNLAVNPPLNDCKVKEQIPYLWWGLRCSDPGVKNGIESDAIATYDSKLAPHLVALLVRENALRMRKEVAHVWADALRDKVISDWPELLGYMIPYYGLLVGAGKVLYKTGQVIRKGRHHAQVEEALREPLSRTDRVVKDLERIFNPKSSSFAKTPAVFVIDDAHFASTDATLLTFSSRLIHKAVTQQWPALIIATHWRKEFAEHTGAMSFAGIIAHALTTGAPARVFGDGVPDAYLREQNYCEIDLQPVRNLSGALTGRFPGLTEAQTTAILERVDGYPAFLEQIISFLSERPKYFDGRNPNHALTADGLKEALNKTTNIFEVVLERLNGTPRDVQEAICLVSMQGMQFSNSIADEISEATISRSIRQPLAKADDPYSMVTGDGAPETRTMGEFVDRLHHSVAAEHRGSIDSLPEDSALREAFTNVLRTRLDDPALSETLDIDDCALTYRLAGEEFERSSNNADKLRALLAFAHLANLEASRNSMERAVDAARRFRTLFVATSALKDLVPASAFESCLEPLRYAGSDEAKVLLYSLVASLRDRAESEKTPEVLRDLAGYLSDAAMVANDSGDYGAALDFQLESQNLRCDLASRLNSPSAISDYADSVSQAARLLAGRGRYAEATKWNDTALSLYRDLATSVNTSELLDGLGCTLDFARYLAEERGELDEASKLRREGLEAFRALANLLKTPASLIRLAQYLNSAGRSAASCGDDNLAAELNTEGLELWRDLLERINTPKVLDGLATSLHNKARLAVRSGNRSEAARLYKECVAIYSDLVKRVRAPSSLRGFADILDDAGMFASDVGDYVTATSRINESLDIRRELAERLNSPQELSELADTLRSAGLVAEKSGDNESAARRCEQILALRHDLAKQLNSPEALTGYSESLFSMTKAALFRGDPAKAMVFWSEGQALAADLPVGSGQPLIELFEKLGEEIRANLT